MKGGALLLGFLSAVVAVVACGSSTKWPACPTSTGVSCSPFPEGTYCPGVSPICVECSAGIYIFQPALCICTEGAWACAPTSEDPCSNQAGHAVYADPSCTVPYVNTERDAETDATTIGDGTADDDETDGATADAEGTEVGVCELGYTPVCCGLAAPSGGLAVAIRASSTSERRSAARTDGRARAAATSQPRAARSVLNTTMPVTEDRPPCLPTFSLALCSR